MKRAAPNQGTLFGDAGPDTPAPVADGKPDPDDRPAGFTSSGKPIPWPIVYRAENCTWPPRNGVFSVECQMPACVVAQFPALAEGLFRAIRTSEQWARVLTTLYRSEDESPEAVRADVHAAVEGLKVPAPALREKVEVTVGGDVAMAALFG